MSNDGSGPKVVNAGGLRAPLAGLIERIQQFGFPPDSDPSYARHLDKEIARLLRGFPDAPGHGSLLLGMDTTSQADEDLDPDAQTRWDREARQYLAHNAAAAEADDG